MNTMIIKYQNHTFHIENSAAVLNNYSVMMTNIFTPLEDISAAFEAAGLNGADKDKLMQTFISSGKQQIQ